jgi:hypothetical protein
MDISTRRKLSRVGMRLGPYRGGLPDPGLGMGWDRLQRQQRGQRQGWTPPVSKFERHVTPLISKTISSPRRT